MPSDDQLNLWEWDADRRPIPGRLVNDDYVLAVNGQGYGICVLRDGDEDRIREAAQRRLDDALRRGFRDRQGENSIASHIKGAECEALFRRWLGRPLILESMTFGKPDVDGYEVRRLNGYGLVVRERKREEPPHTPVVAIQPVGKTWGFARGWYDADEARRHPEWWKNPGERRPAWFVPTAELLPILTLPGLRRIAS